MYHRPIVKHKEYSKINTTKFYYL